MTIVDGNLLKAKIVENGYNISTIAEAIGVDRNTISNIINGNSKPSYSVMNSLYHELRLSSEEATRIFFEKKLTQNVSSNR